MFVYHKKKKRNLYLPTIELFDASNLIDLLCNTEGRSGATRLRSELDAHLHHIDWLNLRQPKSKEKRARDLYHLRKSCGGKAPRNDSRQNPAGENDPLTADSTQQRNAAGVPVPASQPSNQVTEHGIKGIARSATTKFCAEENAKEWHRMHQVNTHTNAGLDHLFYLINFALRP